MALPRVGDLHNRHAGKPGLILGNGPSVLRLDVSRVACDLIGIHRTWRIAPAPRYHVILQQKQWWDELRAGKWTPGPGTVIVTKDVYGHDPPRQELHPLHVWPQTRFVRVLSREDRFFQKQLEAGTRCNHAGLLALELAYWVGYDPIYLIGIDLGDDEGHLDDGETVTPATRRQQRAIFTAAAGFLSDRRVVNLNPDSTVREFPFGELEDVYRMVS